MKSKPRREEVEYAGRIWYRYPDSERPTDRRYFSTGINRKVVRLHRYVWEEAHGHIPKGFVVHHRDGDWANNALDNLELLDVREHNSISTNGVPLEEKQARMNHARITASKWHGSPEGIEFHRWLGRHAWKSRDSHKQTCEYCGQAFETLARHGHTRFCSNKCKAAARRDSGVDDETRICRYCGASFRINKYSKVQCCSSSCAQQSRRKRERQL